MENVKSKKLRELLESNLVIDKIKGLNRIFVPTMIAGYATIQLLQFGAILYQNLNENVPAETSRQAVEYINRNVGPLGKISLFGVWVAEEANSYRNR